MKPCLKPELHFATGPSSLVPIPQILGIYISVLSTRRVPFNSGEKIWKSMSHSIKKNTWACSFDQHLHWKWCSSCFGLTKSLAQRRVSRKSEKIKGLLGSHPTERSSGIDGNSSFFQTKYDETYQVTKLDEHVSSRNKSSYTSELEPLLKSLLWIRFCHSSTANL